MRNLYAESDANTHLLTSINQTKNLSPMPRIALELLQRRLERSGLLDQIAADARILFRKRLHFVPRDEELSGFSLSIELKVGAVFLGYLSLTPAGQAIEKDAYLRWLNLVAQSLSEHLISPHAHAMDVVPSSIAEASRLIRNQHREPLSLADVANAVGLSRERLSRLFHETLGITFSQYLTHTRLETARALLQTTSKSVTEIAFESGFQSLSQFHRRFKSAKNQSPTEFRASR